MKQCSGLRCLPVCETLGSAQDALFTCETLGSAQDACLPVKQVVLRTRCLPVKHLVVLRTFHSVNLRVLSATQVFVVTKLFTCKTLGSAQDALFTCETLGSAQDALFTCETLGSAQDALFTCETLGSGTRVYL